jgi:hypothetical protein
VKPAERGRTSGTGLVKRRAGGTSDEHHDGAPESGVTYGVWNIVINACTSAVRDRSAALRCATRPIAFPPEHAEMSQAAI